MKVRVVVTLDLSDEELKQIVAYATCLGHCGTRRQLVEKLAKNRSQAIIGQAADYDREQKYFAQERSHHEANKS